MNSVNFRWRYIAHASYAKLLHVYKAPVSTMKFRPGYDLTSVKWNNEPKELSFYIMSYLSLKDEKENKILFIYLNAS